MLDLTTSRRLARVLLLITLAVATGGGLYLWRTLRTPLPDVGMDRPPLFRHTDVVKGPVPDVWEKPGPEVMRREVAQYQLAGTFQTYAFTGDDGQATPNSQLAVIDDLRSGQQSLVRHGDRLGPFTVETITTDEVTLTRDGREWVLALKGTLASSPVSPVAATEPDKGEPKTFEDMPALETTPFGKRIAENQWVVERARIFDYAQELMADPRRAAALYQSFSPDQIDGETAGFALNMRGEREFFQSMGLQDNDVIRKVNSMQMKNQARAEYLISEFMKSRMSAVVLDIERNGEEEKRVFIIR